jgi:hypothetical protein
MEITSEGDFKVGNTTLSTPVLIRITEYGHELPEIHSSSPIPIPMYASVANILNWLERDIGIEFCDKKDMERLFFFVMEYNQFAQEQNKKINDIEKYYKIATKAQKNLYRSLDFNNFIETQKAEEEIPFKKRLFKSSSSQQKNITSSYHNPFVDKRFKDKQNKKSKVEREVFNPGSALAYDIFAPVFDNITPEETSFNDVEFDV